MVPGDASGLAWKTERSDKHTSWPHSLRTSRRQRRRSCPLVMTLILLSECDHKGQINGNLQWNIFLWTVSSFLAKARQRERDVKEEDKLIQLSSSRHLLDTTQAISSYCFLRSLPIPVNCSEFPSIQGNFNWVTRTGYASTSVFFLSFNRRLDDIFFASWRWNTLVHDRILTEWICLYVSVQD